MLVSVAHVPSAMLGSCPTGSLARGQVLSAALPVASAPLERARRGAGGDAERRATVGFSHGARPAEDWGQLVPLQLFPSCGPEGWLGS